MKTVFLLLFIVALDFGCYQAPKQAPAINRMAHNEPLDERYLKDVFVPSYEVQGDRIALSNSVVKLEGHLEELRAFMNQVEAGKIEVIKVEGGWQSSLEKKDYWIYAGYFGRLGTVSQFEKHRNRDPFPLIYGFRFSTNGYINWAYTMEDGFDFDEQGKVKNYWHDTATGQQDHKR